MKTSFLRKIFAIIVNRPTQLWDYTRQTYLFYQTYILRILFINGKSQYQIGKNVRLQALRVLTAELSSTISIGENSILYEHARLEAFGIGKIFVSQFH